MLLGVLLFAIEPSYALTWSRELSFDEMINGSSLAFRGTVLTVEYDVVVDEAGTKHPFTVISIASDLCYVGCTSGETLVLRQIGGRSESGEFELFPGLVDWHVGDRVASFSNDTEQPLGGTLQGERTFFRIAFSPDGSIPLVFDHSFGAIMRHHAPGQPAIHCSPSATDRGHCTTLTEGGLDVAVDYDDKGRPMVGNAQEYHNGGSSQGSLTLAEFDTMVVSRTIYQPPSPPQRILDNQSFAQEYADALRK